LRILVFFCIICLGYGKNEGFRNKPRMGLAKTEIFQQEICYAGNVQ
jgi:hypothetical protein